MKSITKYVVFNTKKSVEFVNITKNVAEVVENGGIKKGD